MGPPVARSRGRPRKRKREEAQVEGGSVDGVVGNHDVGKDVLNVANSRKPLGRPPKKKLVEFQGHALVGRYVSKEFQGNGVFLGKIVSYDTGLYRVDYEDGDCEDLDSLELHGHLIPDEQKMFVGEFLKRKNKLDEDICKKSSLECKDNSKKGESVKLEGELEKGDIGKIQSDLGDGGMPSFSELSNMENDGSEVDANDNDDSSSESCEYGQGWEMRSEIEIPSLPPPELPPSSGTIGVPEECVSSLFSVFGFLRSFSICLFLSPFTLDDLVGCLNCTSPNALLDAIHVALLRALRRHLESIASDEIGSKCIRCIDWRLLDNLTWPVYLVHYLTVMGHLGVEWKGFYSDVVEKDYCTLSVGTKLMVLQILCDDALDNSEIRAEIDMREESEVGVDCDRVTTNPLEGGPRHVYPRYSKNFVGNENMKKDAENSIQSNSHSLTMIDNVHCGNIVNVDEDGNGDECRLCGMDGVLLCCDGCPSSYHSRCIGVSKQYISNGEWFCPECTIGRLGPSINVATSLRGAEVLGVDSYAQIFLGTCYHLLVLKVSVKASTFVRYYNRDAIPKVLSALCSSQHHGASYLGICQAILKYWELPKDVLSPLTSNHRLVTLENKDNMLITQLHPFDKENQEVVIESFGSVGGSIVDNIPGSITERLFHEPSFTNVSLGTPTHSKTTTMMGTPINHNFTSVTCKPYEQAKISSSTHASADRSSVTLVASCSLGINSHSSVGHTNGLSFPDNTNVQTKHNGYKFGGRSEQKWKDSCLLYMGSFFKPSAYNNQYAHGDFAASAAASFAVLSSDETQPSGVHASDPRKVMAANVGLQGKAFSAVADRFFWPSTDKKLVEVPRERCSWCLHCKAPVSGKKKACLLNQAVLNAMRAAIKFISGLRLAKHLEGSFYGIAAYTLYIEESLHGLLLGPFQSASHREQWHKKVERASCFSDMKALLLELEENLCTIALSSEWTKMVDNWMDEPSVPHNACPTPSTQKRGPGRHKKHCAPTEATDEDSNDSSDDLYWWQGGKLAKFVFGRGTLPHLLLRKAARQGGSRRIHGISYSEGSEVPMRSRQLIWRSSVEMANNMSQLALQVRYLDHHIRWSDLVRPEQTVQNGKGPETDLHALRNAHICHKKVAENKIIYGVTFGHQKHLSSRLMKSVIEKEEGQDGRDTYWFSETRLPLYLIKEFEEKSNKSHMPSLDKPTPLSKLQKRQLKASRKDVFCYLARKEENLYMCLCACCHRDVLLGVAVKCITCEGYCHKACTTSATVQTNDVFELVTTCKQCSPCKAVPLNSSSIESPNSPLAMQGQDYQNSGSLIKTVRLRSTTQQYQNSKTVAKSTRPICNNQPLPCNGNLVGLSDKMPASSDSNNNPASSDDNLKKSQKKNREYHWGLVWKKKNTDSGSNFRLKNILLSNNLHGVDTPRPECCLCHNAHSHNLMYIRCESCQQWFHADALQLEESKVSHLIGFKCCHCRRMRPPNCPYSDLSLKKTEVKRIRFKGPKPEGVVPNFVSATHAEQTESVPSTPMEEEDIYIQVDNPLLLSESKAEVNFEWNNTLAVAQKLPVRRHTKNENDDEYLNWTDPSVAQLPPSIKTENPDTEWNVSNNGDLDVGISLDYDIESLNFENAEFEPQTYFSFTELLDTDESVDVWQNMPCETSQSGEGPTRCSMCLEKTPPDLCCSICGLKIHSHCLPWEGSPQGETWCCGTCIEWR